MIKWCIASHFRALKSVFIFNFYPDNAEHCYAPGVARKFQCLHFKEQQYALLNIKQSFTKGLIIHFDNWIKAHQRWSKITIFSVRGWIQTQFNSVNSFLFLHSKSMTVIVISTIQHSLFGTVTSYIFSHEEIIKCYSTAVQQLTSFNPCWGRFWCHSSVLNVKHHQLVVCSSLQFTTLIVLFEIST